MYRALIIAFLFPLSVVAQNSTVTLDQTYPEGSHTVTSDALPVGTLTLTGELGPGVYAVEPVPVVPPPDPNEPPPEPGEWPAWRQAIAPGTVAYIPAANLLDDIDPHKDPALNPQYPSLRQPWGEWEVHIMESWSGGIMQPGGRFVIPLHGGHTNGAANNPIVFDLMDPSPRWISVRPPSGSLPDAIVLDDGQEVTGLYADGRIRAHHSGNNWTWTPLGWFLAKHGGSYKSAVGGTGGIVIVDPADGEVSFFGTPAAETISPGRSTYDPLRNAVWTKSKKSRPIVKIPLDTLIEENVGSSWYTLNYGSILYSAAEDLIFGWHRKPSILKLQVFDPVTEELTTVDIGGDMSALSDKGTARVAELNGALWLWDNPTDGNLITRLMIPDDPKAGPWVAEQVVFSGVDVCERTLNGTFGMFQAVPELGGFFLLCSTFSDPVFFAVD